MTSAARAPLPEPIEEFGAVAPVGAATARPPLFLATPASCDPSPLTRARRAAGLTVADLARALHVARTTVSVWEQARRGVARHYWPALGSALGLEPDEVAALFTDYRPARLDGVRLPSLGRARRAAGLTQQALAELVGVAPTTLSMWECAGVPVPSATTKRLGWVLGVAPRSLAAPSTPEPDPRPLRRLRRAARMSRREAAAQLGISVGSLARYEAGERGTPIPVLRRMAAAYGRPVSELLKHAGCEILPLPPGSRWRPDQVPAAITALRVAAGLSKVDLGRLVGRSGQAVGGWESGRTRPTPVTCRRLETIFGLPAGRLP